MIAYPDTSVVLSRLLRRPNGLSDWGAWKYAFTSYLCRVEFLRTVDRLRLQGLLDDDAVVDVREWFERLWQSLSRIRVTENVLMRSSEPFPTVLGTLDAIHLSSALLANASGVETIDMFFTHDIQLARAARSMGFPVRGVDFSE